MSARMAVLIGGWLHLLPGIGTIALGVLLGRSLPADRTSAAGTD
jgi:hypothetical protein